MVIYTDTDEPSCRVAMETWTEQTDTVGTERVGGTEKILRFERKHLVTTGLRAAGAGIQGCWGRSARNIHTES